MITFTITKGIDGKRIETIGKYLADDDGIDKMFYDYNAWKKNAASTKKYAIASYERQIIDDKNHKIMIDFGDYSYFGLIKTSKKEWQTLKEYEVKPSLEI